MVSSSPRPASSRLVRLAGAVERTTERIGAMASWLVLLMVVVGALNAIARYLGRFAGLPLASNAAIELQWYLFSAVFLLGAAWTLGEDAHVRVDVFYRRLPARGRAWVELVGTAVFLVPFSLFVIVVSWPSLLSSWRVREVSPDPGGLARWPLEALVPFAFALVLGQGLALAVRRARELRRGEPRQEQDGAA